MPLRWDLALCYIREQDRAFFSHMIAPRHAKLAAYERELIGLVTAVKHWRPYLWGRTFIIRSDHYSLKYILDQRLSTIPQHQWVSKLLGYDFSVEYKPGRHNIVADALSRKETAASLMSLSEIQFPIFNQLKEEASTNEEAAKIVAAISKGLSILKTAGRPHSLQKAGTCSCILSNSSRYTSRYS